MVRHDLFTAARFAQSTRERPYVSSFTKLPHVLNTWYRSPSVFSATTFLGSLRVVLASAKKSPAPLWWIVSCMIASVIVSSRVGRYAAFRSKLLLEKPKGF